MQDALDADLLRRLGSGDLIAYGRKGDVLGDWTKIPPDAWPRLRIISWFKGTAVGGGVALHNIRVADPAGMPLGVAMHAIADRQLMQQAEAAQRTSSVFHSGEAEQHAPPLRDGRAQDSAAMLRRLEAHLFAQLAAGHFVGSVPRENASPAPLPRERWLRFAADPEADTPERAALGSVLVVPAQLAPVGPAIPKAKLHTSADEAACGRWLTEEWPAARERPREEWLALAKRRWPQLSGAGFRRAWAKARESHREMGRPGRPTRG